MDSGESIPVHIILTYMMITQKFKVFNIDQHDISKTLSSSNQFEVPFEHYTSVFRFSLKEIKSRYLMILFSVADKKDNIL